MTGSTVPIGANWLEFATSCAVPEKRAIRVLDELTATAPKATALIDRSFLSSDQRKQLAQLLAERTAMLV